MAKSKYTHRFSIKSTSKLEHVRNPEKNSYSIRVVLFNYSRKLGRALNRASSINQSIGNKNDAGQGNAERFNADAIMKMKSAIQCGTKDLVGFHIISPLWQVKQTVSSPPSLYSSKEQTEQK